MRPELRRHGKSEVECRAPIAPLAGIARPRCVASQGTALGRAGRVHVAQEGEAIWIGGDVSGVVAGTITP